MNLALAAEKARLLPEPVFKAVQKLHPLIANLSVLKRKKSDYLGWSFALAIFSFFITARWKAAFLWPILERMNTRQEFYFPILTILHFGLLILVGFILGRFFYNKKIKERVLELHSAYIANQEWSTTALQYITEFDPTSFNAAEKEIKKLETKVYNPSR